MSSAFDFAVFQPLYGIFEERGISFETFGLQPTLSNYLKTIIFGFIPGLLRILRVRCLVLKILAIMAAVMIYATISVHTSSSYRFSVVFVCKHRPGRWYGARIFTAVVLGSLKCYRDYPFAVLVDESDGVVQRIGHLNLGIGQVFIDSPKQGYNGEKVKIAAENRRNIRIC